MSNTRHRNAGGPFVIFDPGLGISGSLEISGLIGGRTGINPGIQIATDTFVTGTLKVGANHRMSLTDNELDISSGDLTLDVAGDIEINADGGTITFKDGSTSLGTITTSGFSGRSAEATQIRTVDASSINSSLPIVLHGDTSPSGDYGQAFGTTNITANPSTGTVTATTFAGALSGNATTATSATALATGRTLKVDLTSTSVSTAFDGSASLTDIGVNGTLPVGNGGTGLTSITTLLNSNVTPTSLGLAIGTNVQAYDADLDALAGLTSAADKGIQFTGSGTAGTYDLTAAGKALLDDADAAAQRTTLGLAIGTHVQAYDAELAALAGLTSAANKIPMFSGSGTATLIDFKDEDNMSSNSATAVASQQSVKAYVDANAGGGGVTFHSGNTNNRVITAKGDGTLIGEPNLLFDSSELTIKAEVRIDDGQSYTNENGSGTPHTTLPTLGIKAPTGAANSYISPHIGLEDSTGNHYWYWHIKDGDLTIYHNYTGGSGNFHGTENAPDHGVHIQNSGNTWISNSSLFTGQHRSLPDVGTLNDYEDKIGLIVISSGKYNNIGPTLNKPQICTAHPTVLLSSKRNEKSVYGVIADREGETRKYEHGNWVRTAGATGEDERLVINSLGEGGIWVCNVNGNLENGDYITTCEVPGLGMKQDSEMLCNYTVAKITQDCNFRINASNYDVEEFEFEGKTYRKAFVGCTYHCG